MRWLFTLLLLAACGDDPAPQSLVDLSAAISSDLDSGPQPDIAGCRFEGQSCTLSGGGSLLGDCCPNADTTCENGVCTSFLP